MQRWLPPRVVPIRYLVAMYPATGMKTTCGSVTTKAGLAPVEQDRERSQDRERGPENSTHQPTVGTAHRAGRNLNAGCKGNSEPRHRPSKHGGDSCCLARHQQPRKVTAVERRRSLAANGTAPAVEPAERTATGIPGGTAQFSAVQWCGLFGSRRVRVDQTPRFRRSIPCHDNGQRKPE